MTYQKTRILIVEDSIERVEKLQKWLPEDVRLINARSAGVAIGMLRRDKGAVYAGIMLDYDLRQRAVTAADLRMSGDDVLRQLIQSVSRDVPILVHSMNLTEPSRVVAELQSHGFEVARIPMARLSKGTFLEWVEDVRA